MYNDKNIIDDVIGRKDALKTNRKELGGTFITTGERRVALDKYLFTRVAKSPELKKQEKLLELYDEFFKGKKVNRVELRKLERNYVILKFLYFFIISIAVTAGTSLGGKIGTYINVNTISEFVHLFFENIELFKIELISLLVSFRVLASVSLLSDNMKKSIKIYKDNNIFNINCYEREQLLEYIKEYMSITKVMRNDKELLLEISKLDKDEQKYEQKDETKIQNNHSLVESNEKIEQNNISLTVNELQQDNSSIQNVKRKVLKR